MVPSKKSIYRKIRRLKLFYDVLFLASAAKEFGCDLIVIQLCNLSNQGYYVCQGDN